MILKTNNIGKLFEGRWVLRNLSFTFEKGILAIVGPSGAGKTTLLRIINALVPPDEGYVEFMGKKLDENNISLRRKMAMLSQKPVLFSGTVYDNIAYGLKVRRTPKTEIKYAVSQVLILLGLDGFERRRARTLSGGEAQRVAFARAIVLKPELLLLDEFTANLDPYNIAILEDALRRYVSESGCCAIIVTHNLFQAKRISDSTSVMLNGRIVETGKTEEIFSNPKTDEARKFMAGEVVF